MDERTDIPSDRDARTHLKIVQHLLRNQRYEDAKEVNSAPCHVHVIQGTMHDNEAQDVTLEEERANHQTRSPFTEL